MRTHISERADIPVVILCGGKGTRIREISELVPKPMLPIGGRPILWHIMMIYAKHGFRRFVLCLGDKGDQIKEYFLNYFAMTGDLTLQFDGAVREPQISYHGDVSAPNWTVTLADTGSPTKTGGRLARVAHYLDKDVFMLTYGDGVGDICIPALLDRHLNSGASVTVTGVRPQSRFGRISVDGDTILEFAEKSQVEDGYISGGFMVMNRDFIERYLDERESCVLETDGLARAASDGAMALYRHSGFWSPMDNSMEYNALNRLWAAGDAPWKIW